MPVVATMPGHLLGDVKITCVPTEDDPESKQVIESQSAFHVYEKHKCHKCILPVSVAAKGQKAKGVKQKKSKDHGVPPVQPDDDAFFLHRPYLAFHVPPRVLYMGNNKYSAKPVVLIHDGCFWREYKLQLGPAISQPGVIDPRGVVAWRHNGGDKKMIKADDGKLKGYKVRRWRLWGETGKEYVHTVKANRKTGEGQDPDVLERPDSKPGSHAVAEEVVYLRWKNPLSLHTRCYHFQYRGADFYWKGTKSVKASRACGFLLYFNHLKLVAKLSASEEDKHEKGEVCLGTFTSSVANRKNGTLEFFDATILRFIDEHFPSPSWRKQPEERLEDAKAGRILEMKRSTLYHVFVATAMCMIRSEKEKRHALLDLAVNIAEGGGSG